MPVTLQVLDIVYGGQGLTKGGFFPNGINSAPSST